MLAFKEAGMTARVFLPTALILDSCSVFLIKTLWDDTRRSPEGNSRVGSLVEKCCDSTPTTRPGAEENLNMKPDDKNASQEQTTLSVMKQQSLEAKRRTPLQQGSHYKLKTLALTSPFSLQPCTTFPFDILPLAN
ncbi:hypothetical protein BaRGS_00033166 [Batillaria attramentaria]|uniref:Uncharacterized protein n=1 Tax=Batillaria attramentaria TaxID=370345 RepID=A0ABD0JM87_9CAEN